MQEIVLSSEVLENIQTRVRTESREQMMNFVSDALNTYMDLGLLASGGFEIYAREGEDGELRKLRLPFEPKA